MAPHSSLPRFGAPHSRALNTSNDPNTRSEPPHLTTNVFAGQPSTMVPGYLHDHRQWNPNSTLNQRWDTNPFEGDFGDAFDFQSGFDLEYPSTEPAAVQETDDKPPSVAPGDSIPQVLKDLHNIPERAKGTTHRLLKRCDNVEDALAEMVAAKNSGKGARVVAMVGLLARLTLQSASRPTYACMCLVNMRMERSAKGTPASYERLAHALPPVFPDELGPYKLALIRACRIAIAQVRSDYLFPDKEKDQAVVLAAMASIEAKLKTYEDQPTATLQVSLEQLQKHAAVRRASAQSQPSVSQLKRKHCETVRETTSEKDDADGETPVPPPQAKKPAPAGFHGGPLVPNLSHSGSAISTAPVLPHPRPQWGPTNYIRELLTLMELQVLNTRPSVVRALEAFAACPDRKQLESVILSITKQGLLGMLSLMRSLNPPAAGDTALYIALCYIEQGPLTTMSPDLACAITDALTHVKVWPKDVPFKLELMDQARQQPLELQRALETLIDRLLRGGT